VAGIVHGKGFVNVHQLDRSQDGAQTDRDGCVVHACYVVHVSVAIDIELGCVDTIGFVDMVLIRRWETRK
jgi:hypothetical protein